MRVILTEKVAHLGNIGEIVNVSPGYGRNYLLPKQFAVLADEKNQKELENNKRRLNKKINAQKTEAETLKAKFQGTTIELIKKVGSNGRLFGSVTNSELSKELQTRFEAQVERRLIVLEQPIKSTGTFAVKVKLFHDVEATFQVKVIMDPVQAQELKERQEAALKKAKERKENEAVAGEATTEASAEEVVATEE